jgi:hypothetical protein
MKMIPRERFDIKIIMRFIVVKGIFVAERDGEADDGGRGVT